MKEIIAKCSPISFLLFCLLQTISVAAIPLSRLKAYVLFNTCSSGLGLQSKISRNSWKKLSGNLTQSWNLKQYLGIYNYMFVEQWCIRALVVGLNGRMEFHFWFAALPCMDHLHSTSAPHHFKQCHSVFHSVILIRSKNENCCMNRSSCYLFILFFWVFY